MKIHHLLLLFWILFVTMWCLNAARYKKKKQLDSFRADLAGPGADVAPASHNPTQPTGRPAGPY